MIKCLSDLHRASPARKEKEREGQKLVVKLTCNTREMEQHCLLFQSPEFNSQDLHGRSQLSVTVVPWDLMPFLVCSCTCIKTPYT